MIESAIVITKSVWENAMYRVVIKKNDDSPAVATNFASWHGAVSYACPFEKSLDYVVKIFRDGVAVSYYSNGS